MDIVKPNAVIEPLTELECEEIYYELSRYLGENSVQKLTALYLAQKTLHERAHRARIYIKNAMDSLAVGQHEEAFQCLSKASPLLRLPVNIQHTDEKLDLKAGDEVLVRAKLDSDPFSQSGRICIIVDNYLAVVNPANIVRDRSTQ